MRRLKSWNIDKFSKLQLIAVSEITRDSAQIIFGGMVIGQVFLEKDQISGFFFIAGTIATVGLWIMSVIILKDE